MIMVFALGFLVAMLSVEHRDDERLTEALKAVQQARKAVDRAQALAGRYAQVCEPLLSWPIESTPQVLASDGHADAGTVALQVKP